ncbi:MAG: serine/threonine protein phosphatase, partial [Marinilabiliales bacterium]
GLNSFFPDSMSDNDIIPPIVITSFEKTNEEGTEIISLQGKEGIEISYKDFMFTINFAALEYTRPEKNQYKYMMEGLNDDWIYIGTEHSRTFSNIPPSEYVFRVVGSNNDLKWNEKGASIKIIIAPPWWRTKWAYIAYILFFGFIIYYFIEFRTRKLKRSNQILQEKQLAALEIAKQKEELTIKNKNITDSINYAKRIQQAMMPSVYLFKKLFPESFILYKPKDIVSGDFYWITEKNNKVFVSAVDCTGHGVPGAFMSIIGFDLLRNITEKGIEDPAEILNRLNDGVSEIFSRNNEEQTVKDGMDIALCVIDRTDQTIQFAGAFNPLYLVRENKIIEVKANRFSVGMVDKEEDHVFENHEVKIRDNDMFYIFTDGYPDQFGGPLGKKFKYRRFRHLLLTINNLPVDQQKAFLEENIENWRGELEQVDDILVLGIRLRI